MLACFALGEHRVVAPTILLPANTLDKHFDLRRAKEIPG
jgi:hypothetical protein